MLPPQFERRMQEMLGPEEYAAFAAAFQEKPPVSIRLNASRAAFMKPGARDTGPQDVAKLLLEGTPDRVPWNPFGYYLRERPVFTLDPAFHAGAYYVQEASSMFLYEALRQTVDFSKRLKVLDLCAAPGGKSTLLADLLNPESLLVANEVIRSRVGVLRENLEKWGAPNIAVTSAEAEEFAVPGGWFDVVVTDAPCSGEGLFRKDPDAAREWSPAHTEFCAGRQRRILAAAVEALKPGGVLAYSTCTFNRLENEDNAVWLASSFGLDMLQLDVPPEWGITDTGNGYRFFPHRLRGEGFYIAVFRKKEGPETRHTTPANFKNLKPVAKNLVPQILPWLNTDFGIRLFQTDGGVIQALPASLENEYLFLDKLLKIKWFGTTIGEFKGKDFIPSHALALSRLLSPALPGVELTREQALRFLKKESLELPPETPRGWVPARYAGLNIGWMKVMPNRMNNYLPPERRIRMDIRV